MFDISRVLLMCEFLLLLTSFTSSVVGPSSADSANSHHGFFSLVQNAKGIAGICNKIHKFYNIPSDLTNMKIIIDTDSMLPGSKLCSLGFLLLLSKLLRYVGEEHLFAL